ncbi:glycoprotease [Flagelloscypha sp. PMI_526]|nr:glycoprotease [Flagelloscypha sp. PMI_526]
MPLALQTTLRRRALFSTVRRFLHTSTKPLCILGIESSADDTCAAVVTSSRNILSNVVIKQNDIHEQYGGINPYVALHAHQRNMPVAIRRALAEAEVTVDDLDGIAFTRGPGMGGGLAACLHSGKAIAAALDLPMVGVHHMQAHALTSFLTATGEADTPQFPFLTLLISGGHTLILLATSNTDFKILATTLRCWEGGSPGGAVERYASQVQEDQKSRANELLQEYFVVPMPGQLAFSYSCLDTQLRRVLERKYGVEGLGAPGGPTKPDEVVEELDDKARCLLAYTVQEAAFNQLEAKLLKALKVCQEQGVENIGQLVVSGGVASNLYLRQRLGKLLEPLGVKQIFPPPHLCTDNAAMIAWASMHRFISENTDPYEIDIRPKWSIEDLNADAVESGVKFERRSGESRKSKFNTGRWWHQPAL